MYIFVNEFVFIVFVESTVMRTRIEMFKGIHPGKIIRRELQKRHISQRSFATSIGEHGQALNAVILGRRNLTTAMAVKIEQALGYEEGFLLTLQAFYEIAVYKNRIASTSVSGAPAIRRILFWDVDFDTLDWGRYKRAVIARVVERGSEEEKLEVARFYGIDPMTLKNYIQNNNAYRIHAAEYHE